MHNGNHADWFARREVRGLGDDGGQEGPLGGGTVPQHDVGQAHEVRVALG